ncbi:magnetosome protein Mad29 [Candidatus Magnetoovum chiemensis]|nr:magnetosome protein Mad29 [Candidatus Magnetoovum chiemensis]
MSENIIAIYGPKGGVGKTSISANLSIALAQFNKEVIAVDLDLGGANLHVMLGIRDFDYSLDDFILKKISLLSEALISTNTKNLKVICGGSQLPSASNIAYAQKVKIIKHIAKLSSDIIVLDLAAGSSYNVVDFLFIATKGIIVTTPEITSLMNVYSAIKTAVFRLLGLFFKAKQNNALLDLLEKAKDFKANPHLATMDGFFREAVKIDRDVALSASREIQKLKPLIIINRAQTKSDANVGSILNNLTSQYLGITVNDTIVIPEDAEVGAALKTMTPALIKNPRSSFSLAIKKLAMQLLNSNA